MKKFFCLSLISLCGLASFFIPKTVQPVKAEETKPEDLSGYYELMDGPEQNYADRYNSEYILAYDDGTSMRVFHPNSYTNAYGENNFVTLNYSSRFIKKADLTDTKSAFTIERYNAVDMFRVLYENQNTKCLAMSDSPYNNDVSIANGIYFISASSTYEVLNKRAKITLEKPQYYPQRFVFGIGTLGNTYYEFRYNSDLNMIRPYSLSSSNFVNNPVRLYKLGGCNFAKTPSKIEISSAKTSFETGDSFVRPTVTAYYTDNSSEDVSSRTVFTGFDSSDRSKMGTQTITASFTSNNVTVTTTYEIEMKGCKEVSINLYDYYATGNKYVYFIGEEFQRPTIEVICRIPSQNYLVPYNSVIEEPRSLTFSGFDSSKAGTVTVYVVYDGFNSDGSLITSYTVTIKEPQPTSLEVTNHRDTYAQYEQFVPNITAICHYEDNSTLDVTNSVTVTAPGPFNTLGDYVIDVKFGDLVASYTVHVVPAELVSIQVSNNAKTNYFVGDDFVAPKVFGKYNNGQVVEVNASFSGFSSELPGKYTITVTYGGKETSYVVTVKNPEVVSLTIGEYQSEYFVGDEFVAPVVTGHYDNGEEEVEATFTGFDSSKAGEITITASYNGVSVTFKVEIKARPSAGGCGGSTSAPSITIFAFSLASLGLLILIKKRHAK